jgi:tetratricopeptide (TPR) repeat protein
MAWDESVAIVSYLPEQPDPNPMFLTKRVYQGSSGDVYPLPFIDRIATSPVDRSWKAIHLENRYLRLMVLPEIGGRIHIGLDKTNGYDFFYRQNVIKPALVGLAGPWISGGVEFNWPQHHRPATFMPVETEIERHPDGSVTVWCSDYDRASGMKGMHGVCLHPDSALVELKARLYNGTDRVQTFLWWANVAARVNEHYQSFFPPDVRYVADHAKRAISSFPLAEGTYYGVDYKDRAGNGVPEDQTPSQFRPTGYPANDLSRYANIPVPTSYMIVQTEGNFFGGYDHGAEAGFIHVANPHIAPGKKQWTWGNHEFGYAWDRCLTEEDGPYVELMAGVYTDNQPDLSFLAPGETKSFSQFWYPLRKVGVPNAANLDAALRFVVTEGMAHISLSVTSDLPQVSIELHDSSELLKRWTRAITVVEGFAEECVLADGVKPSNLNVAVTTRVGKTIRYSLAPLIEKAAPVLAVEPLLPGAIESQDQLYLTGLHLQQYRHATRSPEPYWREALLRDPGDMRCNHALGKLHLDRCQFTEAEFYLRRAIGRATELNPNPYDGEVYYSLGLTLRLLGRTEEAYAAFYKATWNAAWSSPAYFALAQIDVVRNDWESADAHLERALTRNTDDLNARNLRVSVLRHLAQQEKANALLADTRALDALDMWSRFLDRAALAANGHHLLRLALLMERSGLVNEAIEVLHLAAAAPKDGSAPLVFLALARCCERSGDSAGSQYLEKAVDASPHYCFPAGAEHFLLLQFGLSRRPESAHLHYYLGCLLYHDQRQVEAIESWERSVHLDATYAPAWRNLGIACFNARGDAEGAEVAFSKAVNAAPEDARILYEQDQLRKRLGRDPKGRLASLLEHRGLVHRRDDLCVELATLFNQLGRAQEALDVLLSRPFQPWEGGEGLVLAQYTAAHLKLGQEALKASRTQEALEHFMHTLHPPQTLGEAKHLLANDSQTYFWIGEGWRQAGEERRAIDAYRRSARQVGDFQAMSTQLFSEMTYWSGLSLRRLGLHEDAEQLFRRMLDYVLELETQPAKIDYFATSLPTLLLFEEDLPMSHAIRVKLLRGCALMGLGEQAQARVLLEQVLLSEPHCISANDVLIHGQGEMSMSRLA